MAHDTLHAAARPPRTRDAATRYLEISVGVFFLTVAALYVTPITWGGPLPRDYMTLAVGRDFLNFWMYGRAAFDSDPARFYDVDLYRAALRALAGGNYPGQTWSYP